MRARATIFLSLALAAAVAAVTLSGSPPRVVRASAVGIDTLGATTASASACQAGETLPGGVSAVRIGLEAEFGPPVAVRVYAGSRLLAQGRRGAGWTGSAVTVPVRPLKRTASGVKLCFRAGPNGEDLLLNGVHSAPRVAAVTGEGRPLAGRMLIEYLAPGRGSWWSRARPVARRMGIGHALSGGGVALLAAALAAAAAALAIGLAWRVL